MKAPVAAAGPAPRYHQQMPNDAFTLTAEDGPARAGVLRLAHGDVPTPVFMPVGTRGTVRTLSSEDLERLGAPIVLANTYHLWLRPGLEVLEKAGGLHRFMNWERPILTDSGGYQVFSLGKTRRIDDEGVTFQSVYDGSARRLTPEEAVRAQEVIGSDIAMVLDECAPYPSSPEALAEAVRRTADWARRGRDAREDPEQLLFGIIQGGTDLALRTESAQRTAELGLDGLALGGLSVGEPRERLIEVVAHTVGLMPADRPRYLMGVGDPVALMETVALGVDMFDCVLPTRMARNGTVWTTEGRVNLRNARYSDDMSPLDPACECVACVGYSRAYLRHLFMAREILPLRLLTEHNLAVLLRGMGDARLAISEGRFEAFLSDWRARFGRMGQDGARLDRPGAPGA